MAAVTSEGKGAELPKPDKPAESVSIVRSATGAIESSGAAVVATWSSSVEVMHGLVEEANVQWHMLYYGCSRDEAIRYIAFAPKWEGLATTPKRIVALEALVSATMFQTVTDEPEVGKEIGKKVIIMGGNEHQIGLHTNIREWVKENCFKDDSTSADLTVNTLVWGPISLRKVQTRKIAIDIAENTCVVDDSEKDAIASVQKLKERGISEDLAEVLARV